MNTFKILAVTFTLLINAIKMPTSFDDVFITIDETIDVIVEHAKEAAGYLKETPAGSFVADLLCEIPGVEDALTGLDEELNKVDIDDIPEWEGKSYVDVNGGIPEFTSQEKDSALESFVQYQKLDVLGRAHVAIGSLSVDTVNYGAREKIGQIKPSGWHTVKYPELISDLYLYNRSHLLMQAAAAGIESDQCNSDVNLITGTRYMNVDGMYYWENQVLDYIMDTGNHVLYRVTPIYKGDNLVARGVQMEAWSVEDNGEGLRFNVYCYNIQPGIMIDYETGESKVKADPSEDMALALKNGSTTINPKYQASEEVSE